jgi:hypothetical protein
MLSLFVQDCRIFLWGHGINLEFILTFLGDNRAFITRSNINFAMFLCSAILLCDQPSTEYFLISAFQSQVVSGPITPRGRIF